MPEQKPLISIITPTYNRADFLGEAIDSVLAQTFDDFELIVVDDGSTDNTSSLVKEYSDHRIRYFYQANQGQSVARNRALEKAKGEYICFLDSDNVWLENKLKKSLEVFKAHPKVDVVYADCILIDEDGNELSRKNMKRYSGLIAKYMIKDNCVSMNTTMTKRECFNRFGGFDEDCKVADDYDLWLRFSGHYNFHYISEYFVNYRVMKNQISSDKKRRFDSNERIIKSFLKRFPDVLSKSEVQEGLAVFYMRKSRYFSSVGNRSVAFEAFSKAFFLKPFSPNVWRCFGRVILAGNLK